MFKARKDIAPAEALLELVQWTASEVDFWRDQIRQIEQTDLTWGRTRVKIGGDDAGETQEAAPPVAYRLYREATDALARYASAAIRAGVAEAVVRLAQHQGEQLLMVITGSLRRLGHDVSPGSEAARVVLEEIARVRSDAPALPPGVMGS